MDLWFNVRSVTRLVTLLISVSNWEICSMEKNSVDNAHSSQKVTDGWLIELRSTYHLINKSNNLTHSIPCNGEEIIVIGNGSYSTLEVIVLHLLLLFLILILFYLCKVCYTLFWCHIILHQYTNYLNNNAMLSFMLLISLWISHSQRE